MSAGPSVLVDSAAMDDDDRDADRAAIMARRRQFVAVALGGLATSCAPGKPAGSTTEDSASESRGPTGSGESGETGSGGESESETGEPRACLKFDIPPSSETESGSDESDTGSEDGGTTGPRPCLAPPGTLP